MDEDIRGAQFPEFVLSRTLLFENRLIPVHFLDDLFSFVSVVASLLVCLRSNVRINHVCVVKAGDNIRSVYCYPTHSLGFLQEPSRLCLKIDIDDNQNW